MRVHQSWSPSYLDVDRSFHLKPVTLLRRLEEAALAHTDQVGLPAQELYTDQGLAWMMHKIGLHIHSLPAYGQELTVSTWSKGIKGFRALREFQIKDQDQVLVSATSLWLLFDTSQQRLKRIPEHMAQAYAIESEPALDWDLAKWKPDAEFTSRVSVPITVRSSDYDPYGHVNHALYLDYLDTALRTEPSLTGQIKLAFVREIAADVGQVQVDIGRNGQDKQVRIWDGETVFALGTWNNAPGRVWSREGV